MGMRSPPHPGETIRHECIEPLGLTVEAASVRGAAEQACVPVIAWASYDAGRHELVIEFVNGMKLTTPVAILQELHEAPVEALGEIEVEGGGMVLRWPRLDVSLWVPALLVGVTGTRAWMAAH
jgi:hypothetical protein